MGKSLNKVQLIGTLGKDAETKFTTSGKAVTNFSIATSYGTGDKEETTWTDVTLWDAEKLSQYLVKGTKVYVEGSLTNRSYEDKNGNKVYKTFVTGRDVILLGSKPQAQAQQAGAHNTIDEDEIPF